LCFWLLPTLLCFPQMSQTMLISIFASTREKTGCKLENTGLFLFNPVIILFHPVCLYQKASPIILVKLYLVNWIIHL
jgi:hypothetical protein